MLQTSASQGYPRGIFTGVNMIVGNVDLSEVRGILIVNGVTVPWNDRG
jgi:hypothetical protein